MEWGLRRRRGSGKHISRFIRVLKRGDERGGAGRCKEPSVNRRGSREATGRRGLSAVQVRGRGLYKRRKKTKKGGNRNGIRRSLSGSGGGFKAAASTPRREGIRTMETMKGRGENTEPERSLECQPGLWAPRLSREKPRARTGRRKKKAKKGSKSACFDQFRESWEDKEDKECQGLTPWRRK